MKRRNVPIIDFGYKSTYPRNEPAGKLADLVILNRNPLDNVRNTYTIHSVMKNGRLYDGNKLNETWLRSATGRSVLLEAE